MDMEAQWGAWADPTDLAKQRAILETQRDTWLTAAVMSLLTFLHTLPLSLVAFFVLLSAKNCLDAGDTAGATKRIALGRTLVLGALVVGGVLVLVMYALGLSQMASQLDAMGGSHAAF